MAETLDWAVFSFVIFPVFTLDFLRTTVKKNKKIPQPHFTSWN